MRRSGPPAGGSQSEEEALQSGMCQLDQVFSFSIIILLSLFFLVFNHGVRYRQECFGGHGKVSCVGLKVMHLIVK